MQSNTAPSSGTIKRFATGIPGLDTVLGGGLVPGDTYIVTGPPGTGKTILANQVSFHYAAGGCQVVYITLLGMEHGRMLAHLHSLSFFQPEVVGKTLHYFSGYATLRQTGLDGLKELVRRAVRDHDARLLVLDGVLVGEAFAESELAFSQFVHDIQGYVAALDCTAILVAHREPEHVDLVQALADGVVVLDRARRGQRSERELEIAKLRGGLHLTGGHLYDVTADGLVVYPRLEAFLSRPSVPVTASRERLAFGIQHFDAMLKGGVPAGSTTMILGSPGSGKTPFGVHFLAEGARLGEPGLHFGFYEAPARLLSKTDQAGIDFSRFVREGVIEIIWQPPVETNLDRLGEELLETVRLRGIKRLFIDGLDGFEQAAFDRQRLTPFLIALSNELRALGVTTLLTIETNHFFSGPVEVPFENVSAIVDGIVLLRMVEAGARTHRLVSIFKMRASSFEATIREFTLTEHGIEVAANANSAETILMEAGRLTETRPQAGPSSSKL